MRPKCPVTSSCKRNLLSRGNTCARILHALYDTLCAGVMYAHAGSAKPGVQGTVKPCGGA